MNHLFAAGTFTLLAGNALSLSAQKITVGSTACEALTAHTPRDDVAHQPGVDVSENAVAPADLNAPGQLNLDAIMSFFFQPNWRWRTSWQSPPPVCGLAVGYLIFPTLRSSGRNIVL